MSDENEYEAYKSWYMYFYDQIKNENEREKVKVPVDVDFDIELIRTDKINVVYILNLLKDVNRKKPDEMKRSVDLILREIERSDNETMRYKRDIMIEFVNTRFFELDPDADIIQEYTQFENESLTVDLERVSAELNIETSRIEKLFYSYTFTNQLTDEEIRVEIEYLKLGLLSTTSMIKKIKLAIDELYHKYKAEGK